jgi:hypothetical protein
MSVVSDGLLDDDVPPRRVRLLRELAVRGRRRDEQQGLAGDTLERRAERGERRHAEGLLGPATRFGAGIDERGETRAAPARDELGPAAAPEPGTHLHDRDHAQSSAATAP